MARACLKAWEGSLEVRIMQHRATTLVNKLPPRDELVQESQSAPEIAEGLEQISDTLRGLVDRLCDLRGSLVQQRVAHDLPPTAHAGEGGSRKRPLEEVWDGAKDGYDEALPFWRSTMETWQRRTRVGGNASQFKFKVWSLAPSLPCSLAPWLPESLLPSTRHLSLVTPLWLDTSHSHSPLPCVSLTGREPEHLGPSRGRTR